MKAVVALLAACAAHVAAKGAPKPHILVVMVDDFGWGDSNYHREQPSPEVVTPNLDALVKSGVEFNRHYVHQMYGSTATTCGLRPSGRLPVHVQLTLKGPCNEYSGIPRNMTTIAAKMKKAGYATHLAGKWDAGMATPTHTPHGRGYDTSLNYFSHGNWAWSEAEWQGSYDHADALPGCLPPTCAKDLWNTTGPATTLNGTVHEEYLFRQRLLDILDAHDPSTPLFMVYTPKLAHYPLQAPIAYQQKFSFIPEDHRRVYAAMVNFLDDQVGNLTAAFKAKGLWDNTLMVLTADNGGYVKSFEGSCLNTTNHGTACFNGEAGASNYGGKYSHFEGGVRGNSFASGGFLPENVRGTKLDEVIHVADWYATACALAGVDPHDPVAAASGLPAVDSLNVWPLLSGKNMTSPRTSILIDNSAIIMGKYKLLTGDQIEASWSGPQYPNATTATDPIANFSMKCDPACLFDVEADPTEHHDIAAAHPDIVKSMMAELTAQSNTIYKPPNVPDSKECMAAAFNTWHGFLGPFQEG